MSLSTRVRQAGHLFFALALLMPFATWWFQERARQAYFARTGFEPEGMGLFGILFLGALAMFVLLLLSNTCALWSFRTIGAPRPVMRKVELALQFLPLGVMVAIALYWWLGNYTDAPQVIEITRR